MLSPEYLMLKFSASKGCKYKDNIKEMGWNNVNLITTKDGVTTTQTLIGGLENMEVHADNYLELYTQQGWQAIRAERPEEKIQGHGETAWTITKTVTFMFRRSVTEDRKLVVRKDTFSSIYPELTSP